MKRIFADLFFAVVIFLAAVLFGMAIFGCNHTSPQTAAQINQIQQQSQVDIAAEQAKAKLDQQQATDNPVEHPIIAASNATKAAQKPLGLIATIAFLACAIGVGLHFYTPLSWLSKILVPVGGAVAAFSFFGVIALPFFPWVTLGIVGVLLIVLVVDFIRAKSIKGGIELAESQAGFGGSSSTATVKLTHV